MKSLMNHPGLAVMRARFAALPPRDRAALKLMAVTLLLLLGYLLVWVPVHEFADSRRADRDRQLELLQFMRASELQARAAAASPAGRAGGQSLLSTISRSAQAFGIKPNRLQPEGDGGVSVFFDAVSFNDLARWLEKQVADGITVQQLAIDRDEAPGRVNARIVLRG